MLIRLCGHFINNSQHIDKMICINGLPDDWVFKTRTDGLKELAPPFTADIPENIPKQIRNLCTPTDVVKYFPPIEKGREGVLDSMTILGVRLDYMTEAGRSMWVRIQRYMDDCLPRHAKVPEPVIVAKDQKSPFETYSVSRPIGGGIEMKPADIPVVDLDIPPVPPDRPSPPIVASSPTPQQAEPSFKCPECDFTHLKKQGVSMHRVKKHPKIIEKAVSIP